MEEQDDEGSKFSDLYESNTTLEGREFILHITHSEVGCMIIDPPPQPPHGVKRGRKVATLSFQRAGETEEQWLSKTKQFFAAAPRLVERHLAGIRHYRDQVVHDVDLRKNLDQLAKLCGLIVTASDSLHEAAKMLPDSLTAEFLHRVVEALDGTVNNLCAFDEALEHLMRTREEEVP